MKCQIVKLNKQSYDFKAKYIYYESKVNKQKINKKHSNMNKMNI